MQVDLGVRQFDFENQISFDEGDVVTYMKNVTVPNLEVKASFSCKSRQTLIKFRLTLCP